MDDIWQQFHQLPKAIRNIVATPDAMATIDRLEAAHSGLDLAGLVMRIMVKEFPYSELPKRLAAEAMINSSEAQNVVDELTKGVFKGAEDYLGLPKPAPTAPPQAPRSAIKPAMFSSLTPEPIPSSPAVPHNLPVVDEVKPVMPEKPAFSAPRPPPIPVTAPSSGSPTTPYSIDDQAEIDSHLARLRQLNATDGPADFDAVCQKVIDFHHVAFPDELMTKRAISILKARLKDIRSPEDTKAMLIRPPKVGGIGLDPDLAEAVSRTIEEQAKSIKTRGMSKKPEPLPPPPPPKVPPPERQQPAVMPPLTRDMSQMPVNPTIPSVVDQPRASRPIYRPTDLPAPSPIAPPPAPKTVPVVKTTPPPKATPSSTPIFQGARTVERPRVTDVTRPTSQALGPAEEMRSLTLTQFRRLGQGAAESARRLLEKFSYIQNESLPMWAETVAGWRQSEVYKIYLDMGRQSLDQSLPITQVIQNRAQSGQEYLSEHEFNIIADMNRRLQM